MEKFFDNTDAQIESREEIDEILSDRIKLKSTNDWLAILQPADVWCSEVLNWQKLINSEAYRILDMEQPIRKNADLEITTVRSALRINSSTLKTPNAAPTLGQHNNKVFDT